VTEPDRLSALSERITALTGRNLTREELVTVAGRAFEHQIDLDDDGQLRALLGGLTSGGIAGGQVGGPPVSYGQPAAPSYPYPQPGYPQAYPQPGWPGMNPMMAPGYPLIAPPLRAPKAPTRHPAGFIVGGILIALGTPLLVFGGYTYRAGYHHGLSPLLLLSRAGWLLLAVAFVLVAANTRAATRVSAIVAASAAALTIVISIVFQVLLPGLAHGLIALLLTATGLAFAVALLVAGTTGRTYFGAFGLVAGVAYGVFSTLMILSSFFGIGWPTRILSLLDVVSLLLFGIAVSCGKVPVTASPGPMYPSYPDLGPPSAPVRPGTPDGTPAADTP